MTDTWDPLALSRFGDRPSRRRYWYGQSAEAGSSRRILLEVRPGARLVRMVEEWQRGKENRQRAA